MVVQSVLRISYTIFMALHSLVMTVCWHCRESLHRAWTKALARIIAFHMQKLIGNQLTVICYSYANDSKLG